MVSYLRAGGKAAIRMGKLSDLLGRHDVYYYKEADHEIANDHKCGLHP